MLTKSAHEGKEMYVSWGSDDEKATAFRQLSLATNEYSGVQRSSASFFHDYSNLDTNVSGRPGLTRRDYDYHRPCEALPTSAMDSIIQCDHAYKSVGLIRNVIDLMGDFACQGIRLSHPNKRVEKFFRTWFDKVSGKERSERFMNLFYRHGNVVVRRKTAKVPGANQQDRMKSIAKPDMKIEQPNVEPNEIPWQYVFHNPTMVHIVGGPLASFVGKPLYAIRIPSNVRRLISAPKTSADHKIVEQLPAELKESAKKGTPVLLDPDKTFVYHYKKDDWQTWALPMIHSILKSVKLFEKLQLADTAALDGAISNIRIFKIGNLEHKVVPTAAAASRLADILENHVGAGTMDIVWGPDIEMLESKTSVHQFLGEEKYIPTLNAMYAGLGIPPTLTGTGGATGTTNNFVSLQTLIQRLEYGREALTRFWNQEIKAVQKAMGFRFPATVEFEHANLGDVQSQLKLAIDLADRGVISDELLNYHFGHNPELERIRTNREQRERDAGRMTKKAGPYHDADFELSLKKIALQSGVVTPFQVGLDLPEPKKGEKAGLEMRQAGGKPPASNKKGQPGRPKNVKDSTKRKEKTFKPKSKAVVEVWANAAQTALAEYLNPVILETFNKKNMRSLSSDEQTQAENIKFGVLCQLNPNQIVDEDTVLAAVSKGGVPTEIKQTRKEWANYISSNLDRKLTIDEMHRIQAAVYAAYKGDIDEDCS